MNDRYTISQNKPVVLIFKNELTCGFWFRLFVVMMIDIRRNSTWDNIEYNLSVEQLPQV